MGQKRMPGLVLRGGVWHIEKRLGSGRRIRESTGTSSRHEAEQLLIRMLDNNRQAERFGVRPPRTFRQAATKYLEEGIEKRSIGRDAQDLELLVGFIGELLLDRVHSGSLQAFIDHRRRQGRAVGTINRSLSVVRNILNRAERLWRDEHGLTWLQTAPIIPRLDDRSRRKPYPLTWQEQDLLFERLPDHLRDMAHYAVNTGSREQEVCKLSWEWEVPIEELEASVFIIPEWVAKNAKERVIVLNSAAFAVVNRQRGKHPERVFTLNGQPLTKIYNSAWKRAREDAAAQYPERFGKPCPYGMENIRVHDLRHTFGRRLRALGASLEDRQDLLGHESGRMTTHYCAAEIRSLIDVVEKLSTEGARKMPTVTFLRIADRKKSAVTS